MKEVPKKDQPEISGGEYSPDGCIPDPLRQLPWTEIDYPQEPTVPVFEPSITIDG